MSPQKQIIYNTLGTQTKIWQLQDWYYTKYICTDTNKVSWMFIFDRQGNLLGSSIEKVLQ